MTQYVLDTRYADKDSIVLMLWWPVTNDCLKALGLPELGFADARKAYADGYCPAGYAEVAAERKIESGRRAAVDAAIASSNRAGRRIGKREAALIHRVLR